jgi:hypothetical protein
MRDMMVQVSFITWRSDDEGPNFLRIGELVNPFTVDSLGVDVQPNDSGLIDVLCVRSNGAEEIFQITPAQVDSMNPVVRRNGQWVIVG